MNKNKLTYLFVDNSQCNHERHIKQKPCANRNEEVVRWTNYHISFDSKATLPQSRPSLIFADDEVCPLQLHLLLLFYAHLSRVKNVSFVL